MNPDVLGNLDPRLRRPTFQVRSNLARRINSLVPNLTPSLFQSSLAPTMFLSSSSLVLLASCCTLAIGKAGQLRLPSSAFGVPGNASFDYIGNDHPFQLGPMQKCPTRPKLEHVKKQLLTHCSQLLEEALPD